MIYIIYDKIKILNFTARKLNFLLKDGIQ